MIKVLKLEGLELCGRDFIDDHCAEILCLKHLRRLVILPRVMRESDKIDLLISDEPKPGYFLVLTERREVLLWLGTNINGLLDNKDKRNTRYCIDTHCDLGDKVINHFKVSKGKKKFYVKILVWERPCP